MKVWELIEQLKRFELEKDVVMDMQCGCNPSDIRRVVTAEGYGQHTGVVNGHDVILDNEE